MMDNETLLKHYGKPEIQQVMIEHAKDKEIAARYGDKFGSRPDVIKYPRDILEFAKQGATSFHCSEELWANPLQLTPDLKPNELKAMRAGWDLILDIDCAVFEYSRIAADLLVKMLDILGIKSVSVKFSGNKGFHIGIPFQAFPRKIKTVTLIATKEFFPDGARIIAAYLKELLKEPLGKALLEKYNIEEIKAKTGKTFEQLTVKKKDGSRYLNTESILAIDTILISPRHLYRMPYSLHEKSGLSSIPINPKAVMKFEKEMAKPCTLSRFTFLDRADVEEGEATRLIQNAIYFSIQTQPQTREQRKEREFQEITQAIPQSAFPPCIQQGLRGLEDGRKRFLFVITNFLTSVGWDYEKIESLLKEWNKQNMEPLRETVINSHIKYHKQQKKKVLPPNCSNSMYYKDIAICRPDNLCQKIKNPVNYAKCKVKFWKPSLTK